MIACLYACEAARKSTVPPAIRKLASTFAACKEGMVKSVGEMFNTKPYEAWKFKHPPFQNSFILNLAPSITITKQWKCN